MSTETVERPLAEDLSPKFYFRGQPTTLQAGDGVFFDQAGQTVQFVRKVGAVTWDALEFGAEREVNLLLQDLRISGEGLPTFSPVAFILAAALGVGLRFHSESTSGRDFWLFT